MMFNLLPPCVIYRILHATSTLEGLGGLVKVGHDAGTSRSSNGLGNLLVRLLAQVVSVTSGNATRVVDVVRQRHSILPQLDGIELGLLELIHLLNTIGLVLGGSLDGHVEGSVNLGESKLGDQGVVDLGEVVDLGLILSSLVMLGVEQEVGSGSLLLLLMLLLSSARHSLSGGTGRSLCGVGSNRSNGSEHFCCVWCLYEWTKSSRYWEKVERF